MSPNLHDPDYRDDTTETILTDNGPSKTKISIATRLARLHARLDLIENHTIKDIKDIIDLQADVINDIVMRWNKLQSRYEQSDCDNKMGLDQLHVRIDLLFARFAELRASIDSPGIPPVSSPDSDLDGIF